ncbi:hypothetical protein GTW20_25265 [Nocardiopsis alba]|uniref:Nucleoside diphosphate kinase-like domain-containing protein n=1 Tax=Nocardiopsis alba TaxID=53437 RepID=A0A7K2IZS6_9ACTN|nr:hypothetical protein [Nocardiopsis alba]MYR35482.1 hypothetical protein [Nocardiopsis alba]
MMARPHSHQHPRARLAAQLGLTLEALLNGARLPATPLGPWDRWWIAYRLAMSVDRLGLQGPAADAGACPRCHSVATALGSAHPPEHTDTLSGPCLGGCLLKWARRVRSGDADPFTPWPRTRLTLILIKPGAPEALVAQVLGSFEVLESRERRLSVADVRRLYPEAYGAAFVAPRDAYLLSGPVQVVLVHHPDPEAVNPTAFKRALRQRHGADELRNHVHIADNPGETLADIAHLLSWEELTELYDRYERQHQPTRMEHHRAVLGPGAPAVGGLPTRPG